MQIFSPPATASRLLSVHGLASPSQHPPATLCRLGNAAAPRAALLAGALTAHSNPLCRVSRPSPRQVFRFGGGRLAGSEVGGRPCWRLYPSTGTANRTPGTTEMAFDYEGQMASVRCFFVGKARPSLGAAQMGQRQQTPPSGPRPCASLPWPMPEKKRRPCSPCVERTIPRLPACPCALVSRAWLRSSLLALTVRPLESHPQAQRSEIIEQARHSSSRARLKGVPIRPPPEHHAIHHPLLPLPPSGSRGARAATDERLSALSGTVLAKAWSDEAHPGLYFCVRRRRARQCAACCGRGPSVGSRSVAVHFVLVSTASAHRHAVSWSGHCVT